MKKLCSLLFLTSLTVLSSGLFSQENNNLDADFLNSLPDSVKNDILDEKKAADDADKKTLSKRPSTKLLQLETVKQWNEFQKQSAYLTNKSNRYGLSLFQTMQSTFMPINEPNFDSNYLLDFGDSISIQTVGNSQLRLSGKSFEIDRDGSILVPEIGKFFLAGINLEQANKIILAKIASLYFGTEAFVTLESIRDINILIAGHAKYPGMYTFNGNTDIFHALTMAGGIKENGSMRSVELKRDGKVVKTYDLYNVLLLGDTSDTVPLRSGDVIVVKPVHNIASTGKGLNIEASFELMDNETLEDLYFFAGGATKNISEDKFNLIRFDGSGFISAAYDISQLADIKIKNSDKLSFNTNNFSRVEIVGEIVNPGFYAISDGDTLSKLVERAGGYKSNAYAFGGSLFREKAKQLEQLAFDKTYSNLIKFIADNPQDLSESAGLAFILSELSSIEPLGRVNIEFDLTVLANNPLEDTLLGNKDKIVIPRYDENVYVFGEVAKQGAVRFSDEFNLRSYLKESGGLTRYADTRYLLVIDPDGRARRISRSLGFLSKNSSEIYPGSTIYIPRELGKINKTELFAIAAPIFSSLALTLASLNSLTNNDDSNNTETIIIR